MTKKYKYFFVAICIFVFIGLSFFLNIKQAHATTSGTVKLFLHKEVSEANATYNSLSFNPPEPAIRTVAGAPATNTFNPAAPVLCESSTNTTEMINGTLVLNTTAHEGCIASFISPKVGQAITISVGDTAPTALIYGVDSANTVAGTWKVYLYKWNGTTLTLFNTLSSTTDTGTGAAALTWVASAYTATTFTANDRIVAIATKVFTSAVSAATSSLLFDSTGAVAASFGPSYINLPYTIVTPNQPALTGSMDDDFTSGVDTTACNTSGVAYNTKWTCLQGTAASTAGEFNNGNVAGTVGDSTEWLWLNNKRTVATAVASNFGTTPSNTFMYQPLITGYGDGTVRTVVNTTMDYTIGATSPVTPFSHSGLVLWTSNTDYVEVQVHSSAVKSAINTAFVALNNCTSACTGNNGTITTVSLNPTTTTGNYNRVWLGFLKTGTSFQAQYSIDGTTWINIGTAVTHAAEFGRVGLNSYSKFAATVISAHSGAFGWFKYLFSATVPTVTTQSVSSIGVTTATGNGNVTAANGGPITERGFVWNTSTAPTTANSKVIVAGTTGAYTGSLVGLTGDTFYYVRAYATNSAGTSYGNEVTFTTLAPPTTLGNGTDGSSSTIAPESAETEIDRFSLSGTDTVTGMTVTLAGNASAYTNISLVNVQTIAGVSKCSLSPTSNTVLLVGCGILVTTSSTEYKIMITPKTHANMPAVPGSSYATTATVTSITSTNTLAGTDSGSATITVDNASPATVTASTATAGDTIVDLSWTNPSDSDFTTNGTVVVLRHAVTAVSTVPVEGTTYTVGNVISATDTVACVVTGSAPATTCQDGGLTNSTVYHYKIFTRDSNGNYNAGTVPTGSPATPVVSNVKISSTANQNFTVGQASTPISTITITDKIATPVIAAANDIRIKIPATFNMTWDETDTIATIGGGAAAKASTTVSYEDLNKTLVINVITDFVASDSVTVSGLSFKNFSAVSSADNLELEVDNAGTTADVDDKTITISSVLIPYWQDGKSVGNLTSTVDWQEISGITQSTLSANSSYLWMQSDGSINKIFAVNASNASSMGEWTLSGITGVDYEDLASARINNQSYIYLADMGDNGNARSTITVYKIVEPTITGSNGTVNAGNIETITMQYPSGSLPSHKDAETLLVDPDTGDMYIITKREAVPGVYFLAHAASYSGTQTLTDLGNMFDIPDVSSIAASGNAVGGNISPNGREILIKSYDVLYLFSRNKSTQTIIQALQGTPTEVAGYVGGGNTTYRKSHPSQEPQGEAVTFDYNGNDYYTMSEFVATEGSTATQYPLFKYGRLTDTPTSTTLQQGVSPDGSYAGTTDTYIWDTNPDISYGGDVTIVSDTAVGVETDQRKGLLKFDVSSIPSNATIVGARLDLDVSVEGQGWKMHRMLVDWNESSTYNSLTAGVNDDNTEASSVEDNRNGVTLDTIVGSIRNNMNIATVQGWVDGTYSNYGWLLEATDLATGDGQQYDSSESATSTQRPKLIVRYIVTSSQPTISSSANQTFTVNQSTTAISAITITDSVTSAITAVNDIRIKIPLSFNMTWDTTDTLANIGGADYAKTGATSSGGTVTVTYEDANKTVVIPVTTNFVAGSTITVYGLSFNNFTSTSLSDNLEVEVDNAGTTIDTDDKTIIVASNVNTPALAQQKTNSSYTAVTSLVTTLDIAATAGNLLVTGISIDKSSGAITVPTGFTLVDSGSGTASSGAFAYKVAVGGETAISWSWVTSHMAVTWVGEYSGLEALDQKAETLTYLNAGSVTKTISTGTTSTTTQADELAFAFFASDSGNSVGTTRSWSNGFTTVNELVDEGSGTTGIPFLNVATKTLIATGTVESTLTHNEETTGDESYAMIVTFKTLSAVSLPTVTTQAVSSITTTTATGNGNITATGGENNDLRGVVYHTATHADPGNVAPAISLYTSKVEEVGSFTAGAFIENITGLTGNTIYYVRAYSHNSAGYFYGPEVSFTASAALLPVSGTLISSVFDTTANSTSVGYNSIMWKGTLGTGKVSFQLSASNCTNGSTDFPTCVSVSKWPFYGGDTCQIGDWFNTIGPNIPIELKGIGINAVTCRNAWNNMRYFRYKVKICSDVSCTAQPSSVSPIVNKIIVNWSS